MRGSKNTESIRQKDFYEETFGWYLNCITRVSNEFTLFSILAMSFYIKNFNSSSFELPEEGTKNELLPPR
jgi:hypothetical protein